MPYTFIHPRPGRRSWTTGVLPRGIKPAPWYVHGLFLRGDRLSPATKRSPAKASCSGNPYLTLAPAKPVKNTRSYIGICYAEARIAAYREDRKTDRTKIHPVDWRAATRPLKRNPSPLSCRLRSMISLLLLLTSGEPKKALRRLIIAFLPCFRRSMAAISR